MNLRSPTASRVVFATAAGAAVVTCYWSYSQNKTKLKNSLTNVANCECLAAEIEKSRHAPQRARLTTKTADDLGALVEKAAADSQIARDRVLRIDPQPAKRIGKTDYLEQSTELELLAVDLRQLTDLLYKLASSDGELTIGTVRLRTPHEPEQSTGKELWLADIILTQRIYAPTTARRD